MNIKNIGICSTELKGSKRYHLIIEHKKPLVIKDIQLYKKDDIEYLLRTIMRNNQTLSSSSLDEVLNYIKGI